jgi:hypothetical protein
MKKKQNSNRQFKFLLRLKSLPLWGSLVGLLLFSSCSTDGEYAYWEERTVPVMAFFQYMADNSVRYEVEYNNTVLADSLPYYSTVSGIGMVYSSVSNYLRESWLNDTLRVYRLQNGGRSLELEQQLTLSPVVIRGSGQNTYSAINLLQFSADAPVQVFQTPETPADSSIIALQFFYANNAQPEQVKMTILAVDQYALLVKSNKLANVADSMKTVVAEFDLAKAVLSGAIELNLNLYGRLGANGKPISNGMAARFFYKVTDAGGTLIQNYDATNAEIKVTSTTKIKNGVSIPRPTYKSGVMQWGYKSATVPFATPTAIINGDKW